MLRLDIKQIRSNRNQFKVLRMKVWVKNLDFQDNRSFLRDFDIYAQIKKYFRPLSKILFAVSIFSLSSGDPIFPFNLPSKRWLPAHDAKSGFQIAKESSSKWTVQNIWRVPLHCGPQSVVVS